MTRNKAIFTLALCLLAGPALPAQTPADSFRLAFVLPVPARFAAADNLGQLYVISTQNAVEKYSADGRLLARYSNNRLGDAAGLDVANPLKVVVWYADFRTVVFLDRSLTVLGELNLISAGIPEVRAVAAAQDGNLWLYDEVAFHLRKVTPAGEPLFESQALSLVQTGRIQVTCLVDTGNGVLAADPEAGLFQFDVYGQFQKSLPWKGIARFTVEQDQLAYLAADTLHIEHLRAFESRALPLPAALQQRQGTVWLAPGRQLLAVKPGGVEVWREGVSKE